MLGQSIYAKISSAIRRPTASAPPVLEALHLLAVNTSAIASNLGVTSAAVSQWRSGKVPIPDKHKRGLQRLLELSVAAAINALGNFAAEPSSSSEDTSFQIFRVRVQHARKILMTLEVQQ